MKLIWSDPALTDLDEILAFTQKHYPQVVVALKDRIRVVLGRVRKRPRSAQSLLGQPSVRTVPLLRYPYRIHYRIDGDVLYILHVHHTSREML
ncbi:MAG TPA: type II toxin-antitoxin system RelE/ParE family toxin [Rhizomicrobium sp.]|jgi:plasmid stabilization system protein ParE|nr:type II toxin-antitoxin system RelE/ParE family toxin [Rhizomicrobium sp.]